MELSLVAETQMAFVKDWDQAGWDAQASTIPWNYTIQIDPPIPDFQIAALNTGRELFYQTITGYQTTYDGNTTVVTPIEVLIQQLLPLPSDPSAPSGS